MENVRYSSRDGRLRSSSSCQVGADHVGRPTTARSTAALSQDSNTLSNSCPARYRSDNAEVADESLICPLVRSADVFRYSSRRPQASTGSIPVSRTTIVAGQRHFFGTVWTAVDSTLSIGPKNRYSWIRCSFGSSSPSFVGYQLTTTVLSLTTTVLSLSTRHGSNRSISGEAFPAISRKELRPLAVPAPREGGLGTSW